MLAFRWSPIIFALFFSLIPSAWAYHTARTIDDNVEVKSGPDSNTSTVAKLPRGTKVNTSDLATGGYFQVRSVNAMGWVPQDLLSFEGGFEPPPPTIKTATDVTPPISRESSNITLTLVGSMQFSGLSSNYNSSNDTETFGGNTYTNSGLSSSATAGFGIILSNQISPEFSIQLGALYLPRSFSLNIAITGNNTTTETTTFNFSYIQLPLLMRFHFQQYFSVGVGAYIAQAISVINASTVIGGSGLASSNSANTITYPNAGLSTMDFGAVLAAGAKLPLPAGPFSIIFDLRYNIGLKNIETGGIDSGITTVNTTNPPDSNKWHDLQLMAGFSLPI